MLPGAVSQGGRVEVTLEECGVSALPASINAGSYTREPSLRASPTLLHTLLQHKKGYFSLENCTILVESID